MKNRIKLKNSLDIKKIENKQREKRVEKNTEDILRTIDENLNKNLNTNKNKNSNDLKKEEIISKIEELEDAEIYDDIKNITDLSTIQTKKETILFESHGIIVDELEENKKLLDEIELGRTEKPKNFELPPSSFFQSSPKDNKSKVSEAFIDQKISDLLDKLAMFKIDGDVVRTYTGPVVTTFEFKPAPNVKVSKILGLQDDLAMALKAQTIRIQAPIPGKDVVGIEVPNEDTQTIYLKELLDSEIFQNSKSPLTMILGKDIVGKPFITDLKKLPHLLIAGTTGSGKSVGINSMILSLLYKNSPDNLRLVMIDPKMLEFSMYNDIPHLLTPVITKAGDAINALANMVSEMERRYTLMSKTKTKNIENYNEKAKKESTDTMPYIVVVIDELADLMMTSGKDVEYSIARLAQMARASGIHLIVATQRPSVDVVTGLIKANLPSRLSYKVGQKIDSKIILDSMGAESLLGRGDMLFTPPGMSGLVRIHAPWSTEEEIEKVVDFLKDQREVVYDMNFIKDRNSSGSSAGNSSNTSVLIELDELYEDAKQIVLSEKKTSISYIQRRLRIGYNRAATIVEQLEQSGILSEVNAKGNREIII
ncbi:MAG: DNA translocase FtsK [Erysipelatoclostridium sp.]|nr:DNA translocase FtsK [Thomasclavelia sp.]